MKIFKILVILLITFVSFSDINAQVVETNRVHYKNEIRITNNKFVFTTENVFWIDGKNTYKFDVYSYKSVEGVENAMIITCLTAGKTAVFYVGFNENEVFINDLYYFKE